MNNTISIRWLFFLCGSFVLIVTFGLSVYVWKQFLNEIDDLTARNEFQRESGNIVSITNSYLFINKYSPNSVKPERIREIENTGIVAIYNSEGQLVWNKINIDTSVLKTIDRGPSIKVTRSENAYLASIPIVLDARTSSLEEYTESVFAEVQTPPVPGELVGHAIATQSYKASIESDITNRYLIIGSFLIFSTILMLSYIIYRMVGRPLKLLENRIAADDTSAIEADFNSNKYTTNEINKLVKAYLNQYQSISFANINLEKEVTNRTRELAELSENLRVLAFRATHDSDDITKRIAAELHDDLCSIQISLKRKMEIFLKKYKETPGDIDAFQNELKEWIDMTDKTDTVARNIIGRFQNIITDYLGLEAGLKDALLHSVENVDSIDSFFINRSTKLEKLDSIMHDELVKIVQEAVRNVVAHTEATRLTVSIDDVGENVVIRVSDNGGGFDRTNLTRSFGLQIMEQRAVYINGSVSFVPTKTGTDVVISVPDKKMDVPIDKMILKTDD